MGVILGLQRHQRLRTERDRLVEQGDVEIGDPDMPREALPLCLGKLAQDQGPLERGQVIDEEDAVQMVDLVLQAARQQAVGLDLLRRTRSARATSPKCLGRLRQPSSATLVVSERAMISGLMT